MNNTIIRYMPKQKKEIEFKIRFGGKPNDINVNTLIKSLSNISSIIDEITNEIGEGHKLEIKVKAPEKGSFIILLGLLPTEIADLLKNINFNIAKDTLQFLVGVLTLRKFLKGKKPEKVTEHKDNVEITTKSGNNVTIDKRIYNVYNNNVIINEAISENFNTLYSDPSIESFEIEDKRKKKLLTVPQNDFETMSVRKITDIPEEKTKIIEQLATLHIFKLVWDKNRKWEFFYRGVKISAFITDESFFESIEEGESFVKGDALEADLQIKQVYNENVNTFINEEYLVKKVHKHIKRFTQDSFNL